MKHLCNPNGTQRTEALLCSTLDSRSTLSSASVMAYEISYVQSESESVSHAVLSNSL